MAEIHSLPRTVAPANPEGATLIGIANHLIDLRTKPDAPASHAMTHMRIQKLAYLAYGHHLVVEQCLLCDEAPEIWHNGPGFRSLFLALQYAGPRPVVTPIRLPGGAPSLHDEPRARRFVERVAARYARLDTLALAELAHGPDSAWKLAAQAMDFRCAPGTVVPEMYLRLGFGRLAL